MSFIKTFEDTFDLLFCQMYENLIDINYEKQLPTIPHFLFYNWISPSVGIDFYNEQNFESNVLKL